MKAFINLITFGSLLVAFSCSSCNQIFRKYINNKYPPVTSVEKSAASVQRSHAVLDSLPQAGLGIRLHKAILDTLFRNFFRAKLAADPTLGISNVGQIKFIGDPVINLGRQEIIASMRIRLDNINNKYLKCVEMEVAGRVAPSISTDTIFFDPSFSNLHVDKLKLRKWIILSGLAKGAVNSLVAGYMDNVNGALKTFSVVVRYPPLPEEPLSKIMGTDPDLQVVKDDTFRLRPRRLTPVILVDTSHISLLAGVTLAPALSTNLVSTNFNLPATPITPARFDSLFHRYDSSFHAVWNSQLDPIDSGNGEQTGVAISYLTLSDMMNELWSNANFSLKYTLDYHTQFKREEIKLGEIAQPDCGAITFNFQPNNCNNVLSDCGDCSFLDVICQGRRAFCVATNAIKYGACQASNAAKLAAATAEWAAQKALCYTAVAGIFILNNLVLPVGWFSGNAFVKGTINGSLLQTVPGGIESLGLKANIDARGLAGVDLNFEPSGLAGLLVCTLPVSVAIRDKPVTSNIPDFRANATIEKVTDGNRCLLRVHTGNLVMPLQFGQPLMFYILQEPQLVLKCSAGIFLGTVVSSFLALSGNQHFKDYLNAAFTGGYPFTLNKNFDVQLPAIKIGNGGSPYLFAPGWGKKSLLYNKK